MDNDELLEKLEHLKEFCAHRRFDDFVSILNYDVERLRDMLERASDMSVVIRLQAKIDRTREILHLFNI